MSNPPFDTVVIGAGVTGRSVVRYLAGRERVLLMDTREPPPAAQQVATEFPDVPTRWGELDANILCAAGRVVLSPGLPLDLPAVKACRAAGVHVQGDLDLFAEACTAPVLAITGTNGKSTVTTLVAHMLSAAGWQVAAGGNLGTPVLDLLHPDVEMYVLELSSFQLELAGQFRAGVATVLNVTDDHLDRYQDLDEYAEVKRRVYRNVRAAVCNRQDPRTQPDEPTRTVTFGVDVPDSNSYGLVDTVDGTFLARGEELLLNTERLPIRGYHNFANVLASLALVELAGADTERAAASAVGYHGLAHRCELVGRVGHVDAINDSKATNPGACVAALAGLDPHGQRNIVLIAGGRGKGFDYTGMREAVGRHVHRLILIGEEAAALHTALGDLTDASRAVDLEAAVAAAFAAARPGDCVLLSPACASFDMFTNFEARGAAFRAAVAGLTT